MNEYSYIGEEDQGGGFKAILSQMPSILWQRRWFILIPTVLGILISSAVAFLLPTKYESTAIMLVQAPSLPADVIGLQPGSATEQRMEAIRQQIINRPALIGLIETNDLYAEERESRPLSELIEEMRDAITLTPMSVETGRPGTGTETIAVRLTYEYKDPVKSQAVTQQLMEQIVEVDSTTNTAQLTETVQFLSDQQADLQRQIAAQEAEIAQFNQRYGGVLSNSNSALIGGAVQTYDFQIAALERDNYQLQSQKDNLRTAQERDPAVVNAEAVLAGARARYAETHPDVTQAKQRLEQAKQFARQNIDRLPVENIDRQIEFNRSRMAELRALKAREMAQINTVMSERSQAPAVVQESAQLNQRLSTLYQQADEISNRLLAARAGARANEEQMGERLRVVDPPVIPDSPSWPDRPLVMALGAVGGLALGVILALAIEVILSPIRDPSSLVRITGSRPLAMVPVIGPTHTAGYGEPKPGFFKRLAFWRRKTDNDDG